MVAALRLVITAVRLTGARRYPPAGRRERSNRCVGGHFCHTSTRLVLQHPTKDIRSKLRLRRLPNLCACCFNDHISGCIFSTSAHPASGLTLRSRRHAAVRCPGASAPRASQVRVSVPPALEGRVRLSERTLGRRSWTFITHGRATADMSYAHRGDRATGEDTPLNSSITLIQSCGLRVSCLANLGRFET